MSFSLHVIDEINAYLQALQTKICKALADLDDVSFTPDPWTSSLGQGCSSVLSQGKIFEKAGVNVSYVSGKQLPAAATQKRPQLVGSEFTASGLSLVIHPRNPYVPTTHANIRFFLAHQAGQPLSWWFGGGWDLTPYYGFKEDCIHWHQSPGNLHVE